MVRTNLSITAKVVYIVCHTITPNYSHSSVLQRPFFQPFVLEDQRALQCADHMGKRFIQSCLSVIRHYKSGYKVEWRVKRYAEEFAGY